MILNQVLLVIGFLVILVWFFSKPGSMKVKAWKRIAIVGFFLASIVAVLFPNLMDDIAKAVGVYSGANLLIYMLVVAFLAFVLNQYVHNRDENERVVTLIRRLAILEARERLRETAAAPDAEPPMPEDGSAPPPGS